MALSHFVLLVICLLTITSEALEKQTQRRTVRRLNTKKFARVLEETSPMKVIEDQAGNETLEHSSRTIEIHLDRECVEDEQNDIDDIIDELLEKESGCLELVEPPTQEERYYNTPNDDIIFVKFKDNESEKCLDGVKLDFAKLCFIKAIYERIAGVSGSATCGNGIDSRLWGIRAMFRNDNKYFASFSNSVGSKGLNVYVMDQEVPMAHPEFRHIRTKVNWGGHRGGDHGAHVAATIVGRTVGVLRDPNIQLYSYGVCKSGRQGCPYSDIFAGLVRARNHLRSTTRRGVVNLSLGGPCSTCNTFDSYFRDIKAAGGVPVVAAGNSNRDACRYQPASEPDAITVGAYGSGYNKASFSNYGNCIDTWGPGVSIYSALNNNRYGYMSGTSMASPSIAGIVGSFLLLNNQITFAQIKARLRCRAGASGCQHSVSVRNSRSAVSWGFSLQCDAIDDKFGNPGYACQTDSNYVNGWDGPVNVNKPDTFLGGAASVHNNHREDRLWKFRYCKGGGIQPSNVYNLPFTGWDAPIDRRCRSSNEALVGRIYSVHNNHREDRIWRFSCGRLPSNKRLSSCSLSGYVNGWDAPMNYACPFNGVITRVISFHNNHREDRLWRFTCCRIFNGVPPPQPTWRIVPGLLKQISVGLGSRIVGVNKNDDIFRRVGNGWALIPGKLIHVSIGCDGKIWGVNRNHDIFEMVGNVWRLIPGKLKMISVGNAGNVYGVNSGDMIYRYNGRGGWIPIGGRLKYIDVGCDGKVWGVNSNDDIYEWNGGWRLIPGKLKQISVGNARAVWGVNRNNDIFRRDFSRNTWIHIPGKLKHVDIGNDGYIWGVNSNDQIYIRSTRYSAKTDDITKEISDSEINNNNENKNGFNFKMFWSFAGIEIVMVSIFLAFIAIIYCLYKLFISNHNIKYEKVKHIASSDDSEVCLK